MIKHKKGICQKQTPFFVVEARATLSLHGKYTIKNESMSNTPIPNFIKMGRELKKNASRYAASESVKFFKESFVKGGFTDSSFQKWSKSNSPLAGKRTMQKTMKLMRSIKKKSATMSRVVVIADSDYADIHNSGGTIEVTAKMKRYFWAKYYEFNKEGPKAEFCKAMALRKVGSKITIPKHQFMGNSQTMMTNFDKWFGNIVKTQIEANFNNPTISIQLRNV